MSFTTVDNVKLFLSKDTLTTLETSIVTMLIPLIDGVIKNYCGWELLAKDYTDVVFDGTGSDTLDLRVYPINSVTSVKIREDISTFTDVTSSLDVLTGDSYLRLDQYAETITFTPGTRNIYISFNAGFVDADIPAELVYAANFLTTINFKKISNEMIGISEGKFKNIDVKFDSLELPVLVKRVLDRYRIVSVY